MSKVLVAGSINMDVVATADRHPLAGETVAGRTLHFFPGGKGANQAVAAAKLGGDTFMIGKLGNDGFAKELDIFLRTQNVNISHVYHTSDAATGTAVIVVAGKGENTIVVVPGANGLLGRAEIEKVSVETGDVLVSQFEIPFDTIEYFFIKGKQAGARTILNPAPAKAGAEELLGLADILVINETELAFFLGLSQLDENAIAAAAHNLRARATQIVVVTLGASGVFMLNGEEQYRIPGHKVEAVDTTGAGDCFVGALASQLSKNLALNEALTYANAAASICVQRLGAGTSMPISDEVSQVLRQVKAI